MYNRVLNGRAEESKKKVRCHPRNTYIEINDLEKTEKRETKECCVTRERDRLLHAGFFVFRTFADAAASF